jgi:polysaccharide export outer membrane protein
VSSFKDSLRDQKVGVAMAVWRLLTSGGIAVVVLLGFGCQSPSRLPSEALTPRPVTLSAGDVVKLTFPGAPELNQSQKIRADGKLTLPQIGEVDASGKTLVQFQNELTKLYRPQLRNSDVLVTLENSVTQVYISGAINKPGKLSFDRPTTILQAIAEAGGVSEFGSLKKVRIVRVENGQQRVQIVDLRSATSAFYVRDGDIITIPQSAF